MTNVIEFNGVEYYKQNDGYYRDKDWRLLHRVVWEYYNCEIPKNYEIHHKDFNKDNNDISNLQLLTTHEHRMLHADLLTQEQRIWKRNNLNLNARPKAIEWHKSEAGHEWHKEQIAKQREDGVFKKELICTNCGNTFIGELKSKNHFCCNACKSQYRRKMGLDDITKVCPICGKEFQVNKYKKGETCSRSCANRMRARKRQEFIDS